MVIFQIYTTRIIYKLNNSCYIDDMKSRDAYKHFEIRLSGLKESTERKRHDNS